MEQYPGITVTGATIPTTVAGFGDFKILASEYLLNEGIGKAGPEGLIEIDTTQWYPLDNYLRALNRAISEVSEQVVYEAGLNVPKNAEFPPQIHDVNTALQLSDIAYHMNHRKDGVLMFDPSTGKMLEGIGHYAYSRPNPNKNEIIMMCDNPWPCAFDRGIITALGLRFGAKVKIAHDKTQCRNRNGRSCTYTVTW